MFSTILAPLQLSSNMMAVLALALFFFILMVVFYLSAQKERTKVAELKKGLDDEKTARAEAELKAKEVEALQTQLETERKARQTAEQTIREVRDEVEEKRRLLDEVQQREESSRKARELAEQKVREANEEAERKAREDAEERARDLAARKAKEETERKAREDAARKAKEETERKAREVAARKTKPEEEQRTPTPQATEEKKSPRTVAPVTTPPREGTTKILLVEDSSTMRTIFKLVFSETGYVLTAVEDGKSALAKAREMKPDIIFADLTLEDKDGYQVCQEIRAEPEFQNTPVVILHGPQVEYDEAKAKSVGATSGMAKPFETQALIDRVSTLLA
jgi:CheY-like chemotaxis protein